MNKWMYDWISIPSFFLHECPFIHKSHQVSLCARVTMSVCKKIIENQPFPNISEIFPNISQLYYRPKTIFRGIGVFISNQATCEPKLWCTNGVLISTYFLWVEIVSSTVSQDNAHMIIARYVLCCMKPDLQHKTLAMADCDYSKVVITKRNLRLADPNQHPNFTQWNKTLRNPGDRPKPNRQHSVAPWTSPQLKKQNWWICMVNPASNHSRHS